MNVDYLVEMKVYFHGKVEAVLIKAGNGTTYTIKISYFGKKMHI